MMQQEDNACRVQVRYTGNLDGSMLKWLALLTMLLDHIGAVFFRQGTMPYILCRSVGRISFPLFCFLLVEGFCHTGDVRKYIIRMTGFAFLAEIPFDLVFYGKIVKLDGQNVLFTMAFGLVALVIVKNHFFWDVKSIITFVIVGGLACLFRVDYTWFGILLILIFYFFRESPWQRNVVAGAFLIWHPVSLLVLLPLSCYNGKRGKSGKYFFYWFYPVHLMALWMIRVFLIN